MLKILLLPSLVLAASLTSVKADTYTEYKLENLRESYTYAQCAKMNRRAGFLHKGKGAKSKNFIINDACMRRGGIY